MDRRRAKRLLLTVVLVAGQVFGQSLFQGGPWTIDQLLPVLAKSKAGGRGALKPAALLKAIRSRGVAFVATEENVRSLQEAGATDEVVAAIRELAPAPPPPPAPKPAPQPERGTITVSCAPAECGVLINTTAPEPTTSGVLRKTLPVGKYRVIVAKGGYTTVERQVQLTTQGESISVTLRPDAATISQFGGVLARKMIDAVGDDGVDLKSDGSWTVQTPNAAHTEWTFAARFGTAESAFAIQKPEGVYEITCRGATCSPAQRASLLRGRTLKPEQAATVDNDLRQFRRFHLANLVPMWRAGLASGLDAAAETDRMTDDRYRFRLSGADDIYEIQLDSLFRPVQVSYSSKLVGGLPTVVTYENYLTVGKLTYPKQVTIRMPEQTARVIKVLMNQLQPLKP